MFLRLNKVLLKHHIFHIPDYLDYTQLDLLSYIKVLLVRGSPKQDTALPVGVMSYVLKKYYSEFTFICIVILYLYL